MNPRLYILMRNDLASMNPGKAMAQAAHAHGQFVFNEKLSIDTTNLFNEWESQGVGFGTTIVLEMDINSLLNVTNLASYLEVSCGIVTDETYPLQDGKTTHLIPLETCGYVFLDVELDTYILNMLKKYPLHH